MAKKILILGGGPGGYVAAIRAAQLGAAVHLIKRARLGGTCLNAGCIPTKALLHTAQCLHEAKDAKSGILADNVRVDWDAMMKRKTVIMRRLVQGVAGLLRASGVTVHTASGAFAGAHTLKLDNGETLEGDVILIASGSEAVHLSFPGADLPGVIDSTGALELPACPKSLAILGGGVIGVEFAYLFRSLGAEVTILEALPQILPPIDAEIAGILRKDLEKQGVRILTGTKLSAARSAGDGLTLETEDGQTISCGTLLVAVGRRPQTAGLGLDAAGIRTERGAVCVDEHFETNVLGVYAIGDCNGRQMLAHAASAQGIAAVEHAMGLPAFYNEATIPGCIYTQPEVASAGMTEAEAAAQGIAVKIGRFQLSGNGKAMIEGCDNGLVKLIADENTHQLLGAHLIGPCATDLIGELSLAIGAELTDDDILAVIHAHPTLSEGIAEAARAIFGGAIHWPAKR